MEYKIAKININIRDPSPEQETKVALWFLHHYAGVLMYFPKLEELKDTVICISQIVYDSATNLIVDTFKFARVGKAASEVFRKTGQFSLDDIERVTASISKGYIPLLKLVKLLEYLNIITPINQSNPQVNSPRSSKVKYFMSCALQNATHEELDQWWASVSKQPSPTPSSSSPLSPAPLFIHYECGYVPIGVFPAMIASLSGHPSLKLLDNDIKKNYVQSVVLVIAPLIALMVDQVRSLRAKDVNAVVLP